MSRFVTIHVTREDIAAGGCFGYDCPVNRGALRAFPAYGHIHVTRSTIVLGGFMHPGPNIPLPHEAVAWITRRDDWRTNPATLEPFAFTVTVPELAAREVASTEL